MGFPYRYLALYSHHIAKHISSLITISWPRFYEHTSGQIIDICMWLSRRLYALNRSNTMDTGIIPWSTLYGQFGFANKQTKEFTRSFKRGLSQVAQLWPGLHYEVFPPPWHHPEGTQAQHQAQITHSRQLTKTGPNLGPGGSQPPPARMPLPMTRSCNGISPIQGSAGDAGCTSRTPTPAGPCTSSKVWRPVGIAGGWTWQTTWPENRNWTSSRLN